MKKVIDGVPYIMLPEIGCNGCIADTDYELCRKLDTHDYDCEPLAGWVVNVKDMPLL